MEREAGRMAFDAIQKATARAATVTESERALIRALAARYTADPPEDRSALDAAYAREMRDVVRRFTVTCRRSSEPVSASA
jgi:hypothetical protein